MMFFKASWGFFILHFFLSFEGLSLYMRPKRFLFLMILLAFSCQNTQEKEIYMFSYSGDNGQGLHLAYSTDGYKWAALNNDQPFLHPELSKDSLLRDPCIIQGQGKKFHMVWTISWDEKGIGYSSSEDLINWTPQQFIPVMANEPKALNCWAPELFYDRKEKQYMIYWSTTIPGRFNEGEGDDNYNHRIYYVTTKDFKTFSETKLLYDGGFNVTDATIIYDDEKYYMFLKDETRSPVKKHIRIAVSENLTSGYKLLSRPITPDWVEGPTVIKINDYWMVYYNEYTRNKFGAVRSEDFIRWEIVSESLNFPPGARHGTVFKTDVKMFTKLLRSISSL